MKATTSLFIDKYHPKVNDECSISVRVTFDRKKRYYKTNKTATVSDFSKAQGDKPRKEFKELSLELQTFEKKAADIIKDLTLFTFAEFEKRYYSNRGTRDKISIAFEDYAGILREAGQIGTAVSYECANNSLKKYSENATFSEINPAFLRGYETWMLSKGKSITTVSMYLRSLRALFNNAIAEGLLSKENYPFGKRKYEIPTGNNVKKAITLKDIGAIYNYQPKPGSIADKAKDFWIFMYLCNGMNVKDMSLLKYENIKGDIIEFIRAKTIRTKRIVEPIRVVFTDEVKAIVKKWGNEKKGPNTFIFPILQDGLTPVRERDLIQLQTSVINFNMKAIAKLLKIETDCTTYVARHSFATVLKRSGASSEFIGEALGHADVKTTSNYLGSFEDESKVQTIKALTAF